ncbi:MAG: CcmD family protein [Cytophagales bacterium]|nr:CcmD family protein [Cytophagales bacterium]
MKKIVILFVFVCMGFCGIAQEKTPIEAKDYQNGSVEMADQFRAEGKIYVVVAVALVILSVLAGYAFRAERKVSTLEKRLDSLKGKASVNT